VRFEVEASSGVVCAKLKSLCLVSDSVTCQCLICVSPILVCQLGV
jgi:hypothetical protein